MWGALFAALSCGAVIVTWRERRHRCFERQNFITCFITFFYSLILWNLYKMTKEKVGGCCLCSHDMTWAENPLVYCDGQDCTVAVHKGL